jgi:hypothetical protein
VGGRNDLADKFWSAAPESMTYTQYMYQPYCKTKKKSCEAKGWWRRERGYSIDKADNMLTESL